MFPLEEMIPGWYAKGESALRRDILGWEQDLLEQRRRTETQEREKSQRVGHVAGAVRGAVQETLDPQEQDLRVLHRKAELTLVELQRRVHAAQRAMKNPSYSDVVGDVHVVHTMLGMHDILSQLEQHPSEHAEKEHAHFNEEYQNILRTVRLLDEQARMRRESKA
jgi:hypothetical protein